MHRTSWALLLATALSIVVLGATVAHAAPVTYNISGTVSGSSLGPDVQIGDPFSGSFTYDPMETNSSTFGLQTIYRTVPPHGLGIQIDSVGNHAGTHLTDTSQPVDVVVENDINGSITGFKIEVRTDTSPGFNGGESIANATGIIGLRDTDGTVFNDQSLPTSLTLSDFETATINFEFDINDRTEGWRGTITGMSLAVPVPAAMWLGGVMLIGMILYKSAVASRRRGTESFAQRVRI